MGVPFPATWTLIEGAHLNGGREWFGYLMNCVQEPRLARFDRYLRASRSVKSTWRVDGQDCADADAAWAALQIPPTLTPDERSALASIPDEPTLWTNRGTEVLHTLRSKGMVQWGPPAHLSRTPAGRAALTPLERGGKGVEDHVPDAGKLASVAGSDARIEARHDGPNSDGGG